MKSHKQRMIERRARQLRRTANCSPFGRKLIRTEQLGPDGVTKLVMIGVERTDEQGAYRAAHWNKTPVEPR